MAAVASCALFKKAVPDQLVLFGDIKVFLFKHMQKLAGNKLSAQTFTFLLDQRAELRMHFFGQMITKVVGHNKRRPAFPGLGIDADNWLVLPADVCRVDRKIRHFPIRRA